MSENQTPPIVREEQAPKNPEGSAPKKWGYSDSVLVAGLLREYADDDSPQAVEQCSDCSPVVMCRFHSLMSALARRTSLAAETLKSLEASRPEGPRHRVTESWGDDHGHHLRLACGHVVTLPPFGGAPKEELCDECEEGPHADQDEEELKLRRACKSSYSDAEPCACVCHANFVQLACISCANQPCPRCQSGAEGPRETEGRDCARKGPWRIEWARKFEYWYRYQCGPFYVLRYRRGEVIDERDDDNLPSM